MIEELINAIRKERHSIAMKHINFDDWSISVYVNNEGWYQAMSEMRGEVSQYAMEMYDYSTIYGYPIHRVVSGSHPQFAIFSKPPRGYTND